MFQAKVVEKTKTHLRFNKFFPPKIVPFMRLCGKKYGRVRQATGGNKMRRRKVATMHKLTVFNIYCCSLQQQLLR